MLFICSRSLLLALFSSNIIHLLVARGIQALGAGGLFPISSTVIGEQFPKEKRGMALGFIGMVWGVAAIIGPLAGGWLIQWFDWQSIFYLSFFLSFISLFFIIKHMPESKPVHSHPLDFVGMVILAIGLFSLTYMLSNLDAKNLLADLSGIKNIVLIIVVIASFTILAFYETKVKAPVRPVKLFKDRDLNISYLLSFARGITEAGLVFLPFYAMTVLNVNTGIAGSLLIASAITLFLFTEPAGLMVDRIGPNIILLIGAVFVVLGGLLMSIADSYAGFIGYQVVLGIGLSGLSGAPIRYVVLHQTSELEKSAAQSLVSLFSSFGIMVGSAIAGALLSVSGENNIQGFQNIYIMVAIVALISAIAIFGMKKLKEINN
ncbi:MAG: MFS transporter [Saprospiraceae bacterium]